MSGFDSEVENNLERALSTDINDLQSIAARGAANLQLYGQSLRVSGVPADSVRNVVYGGLIASPSGSDVAISPGMLGQDSATILPVPGALDSTYRLATNPTVATVTMPSPGGDTYYLIEAKTVQVVTESAVRDIYNPTTQTFAPTLVDKQTQNQIGFQLLTGGTSAPAPTGGDWVPIAIVKRPAGGGSVAAADIIDVRPLAENGRERPSLPVVQEGRLAAAVANAGSISLLCEMDGPGGLRSYDQVVGTVAITGAPILSPGVSLTASTWYYLYLAPWSTLGLSPRFSDANGAHEGVLVLSSVAPSASRRNSGTIPLPAPFSVVSAPALSAYLVGALRWNAAATDWIVEQSADLHSFDMLGGALDGPTVVALSPPGASNAITPGATVPTAVRAYAYNVRWTGMGTPGDRIQVYAIPTGTTTTFGSRVGIDAGVENQFFDITIDAAAFGTNNHTLVCAVSAVGGSSTAAGVLIRFDY